MALNDNVLDDLEGAGLDDVVQLPDSMPANKQQVNIVVAKAGEDTSKLSEIELAKLPASEVSFQAVEDGVLKVVDLKDVEAEIAGKPGIAREHAEYVSAVFESLTNVVSLSEFTSVPTRTNFDFVKRYMKQCIATEQAATLAKYQLFVEEPVNAAKEVIEQLVHNHLPTITQELIDLRALAFNAQERVKASKDMVVKAEEGFIDLSKASFDAFDFKKVELAGVDRATLQVAADNVSDTLQCSTFKAYVLGAPKTATVAEALGNDAKAENAGTPITIQTLIDFYSSANSVDYLQELAAESNKAVEALMLIDNGLNGFEDKYEAVSKYIIENSAFVHAKFKTIRTFADICTDLPMFNTSSKYLLNFFSKL